MILDCAIMTNLYRTEPNGLFIWLTLLMNTKKCFMATKPTKGLECCARELSNDFRPTLTIDPTLGFS